MSNSLPNEIELRSENLGEAGEMISLRWEVEEGVSVYATLFFKGRKAKWGEIGGILERFAEKVDEAIRKEEEKCQQA